MSEDDKSSPTNKDKDSTLLLTKDGHRYYVSKRGVLDSRNVITLHEPDSSADMVDADEESNMLDTSDPREASQSPEELNNQDVSEGDNAPKQCTYHGCTETTTQVAKLRKPWWMCKKHRKKMYKDKYKKKKRDQAMNSGKLDENTEERPVSVNTSCDRPARPSLIEQVLNQKRLSLLRSPDVISFLQQQQQQPLLATQNRSQSQQSFQGC